MSTGQVGAMANLGSDVPVTRHFSPLQWNGTPEQAENFAGVAPRFNQQESFCDWVSIYQTHLNLVEDLPRINDGAFVKYSADGSHEYTTLKKFKLEGSHESGVFFRCDGKTVWFEGNVSKFDRQDNVFGFSFIQCLHRINCIAATLGLPAFTAGTSYRSQRDDKTHFTGARITRLDLTANFQSGSPANAYAFMRHLSMQQASRLKTGTYGEGETVDFGRGSRRVYSKAYLKAPELLRHMRKAAKPSSGKEFEVCSSSRVYDPYTENLAHWCDAVGLVRFETTYKSTFLIDNNYQFLGGIDMRCLEKDYVQRQDVFTRANCEVDEIASLDTSTLACYRMWQSGDDLTKRYKKSMFYRHRARLLPHGIDIAIKSNVLSFQPRVRVIKLSPCPVPDFYQLPSPSFIRLVA